MHAVLSKDGLEWKCDANGVIHKRASASTEWEAWDPDATGPLPPDQLRSEEVSSAGGATWIWLLAWLFAAAALTWLVAGIWLRFVGDYYLFGGQTDPFKEPGDIELIVYQIYGTAFQFGMVLFGFIVVGFSLAFHRRFLVGRRGGRFVRPTGGEREDPSERL